MRSNLAVKRCCRLVILALAGAAAPLPVFACRLALVLAIDVSTSVDQRDYSLQRNGLANAIRSQEVKGAFLSSGAPVALSAYEWSGQHNQRIVLAWKLMTSVDDMDEAAETIESVDRSRSGYPTSLGRALSFGADVLAAAPGCQRQTIDVSGDGRNNDGYPPDIAYQRSAFDSINVNALAIGGSEPLGALVTYFEENVIRGSGAFVEVARNHEEFEEAMRRKLVREVATFMMSETNFDK